MAAAAGLDRPIFIVSTPRSGSSLLFVTLARAPGVFTIGGESHQLIETIPGLHPFARGWASNVLSAVDATPPVAAEVAGRLYAGLRDREGRLAAGRVRAIEKTPKNALRVPFLATIFPDALFVYLYRDPRETIASMMEAWETERFVTYPRLPGWQGRPWSLALVPGWRALIGRPLAEIVACQWAATTRRLLDDLAALPAGRVLALDHADVIGDPASILPSLAHAVGLEWDVTLGDRLPPSPTVVSAPGAGKWRLRAGEIEAVLPLVAEADEIGRAVLADLRI